MSASSLLLLSLSSVQAVYWDVIAQQYIDSGVEVPYTLRGVITCLIPGLNALWCQGPRAQALKKSETVYGRPSFKNGQHNGVELRFLKVLGLQRKTEFGRTYGANVAIDGRDGEVEFGRRIDAADFYTENNGGVAHFDRNGGGVDLGWRAQAADNLIQLHSTPFGVEYVQGAKQPFRRPHAKGESLKYITLDGLYHGYRSRPDWYKSMFRRPGDEYTSKARRACPWCHAIDGSYP